MFLHEDWEEFVEEDNKDADWCDPANEEKQRFHRTNRNASVVGQLLFHEFTIQVPTDKERHQKASKRHQELRHSKVEEVEETFAEDGYILPRSER